MEKSTVDVRFVEDVFVPHASGFDGGPSCRASEGRPVRPNKRRQTAGDSKKKEFIGDFREDMRFPAPLNLKP